MWVRMLRGKLTRTPCALLQVTWLLPVLRADNTDTMLWRPEVRCQHQINGTVTQLNFGIPAF